MELPGSVYASIQNHRGGRADMMFPNSRFPALCSMGAVEDALGPLLSGHLMFNSGEAFNNSLKRTYHTF